MFYTVPGTLLPAKKNTIGMKQKVFAIDSGDSRTKFPKLDDLRWGSNSGASTGPGMQHEAFYHDVVSITDMCADTDACFGILAGHCQAGTISVPGGSRNRIQTRLPPVVWVFGFIGVTRVHNSI